MDLLIILRWWLRSAEQTKAWSIAPWRFLVEKLHTRQIGQIRVKFHFVQLTPKKSHEFLTICQRSEAAGSYYTATIINSHSGRSTTGPKYDLIIIEWYFSCSKKHKVSWIYIFMMEEYEEILVFLDRLLIIAGFYYIYKINKLICLLWSRYLLRRAIKLQLFNFKLSWGQ